MILEIIEAPAVLACKHLDLPHSGHELAPWYSGHLSPHHIESLPPPLPTAALEATPPEL